MFKRISYHFIDERGPTVTRYRAWSSYSSDWITIYGKPSGLQLWNCEFWSEIHSSRSTEVTLREHIRRWSDLLQESRYQLESNRIIFRWSVATSHFIRALCAIRYMIFNIIVDCQPNAPITASAKFTEILENRVLNIPESHPHFRWLSVGYHIKVYNGCIWLPYTVCFLGCRNRANFIHLYYENSLYFNKMWLAHIVLNTLLYRYV